LYVRSAILTAFSVSSSSVGRIRVTDPVGQRPQAGRIAGRRSPHVVGQSHAQLVVAQNGEDRGRAVASCEQADVVPGSVSGGQRDVEVVPAEDVDLVVALIEEGPSAYQWMISSGSVASRRRARQVGPASGCPLDDSLGVHC
jgi:hypothetical protein